MEVINGGQGNSKKKRHATPGVLADGTSSETGPCWTVTKSLLAEYLFIVTQAAEAAINKQASDPAEEAARALAVGFGAAMIHHGELLNAEGYDLGYDLGDLGLAGDGGTEIAHYDWMRGHVDARHRAEREAERPPLE